MTFPLVPIIYTQALGIHGVFTPRLQALGARGVFLARRTIQALEAYGVCLARIQALAHGMFFYHVYRHLKHIASF